MLPNNFPVVYPQKLETGDFPYLVPNKSIFEADLENLFRLETETRVAIEWFEDNYQQLNQDECHFLLYENSVVCFGNKFSNTCQKLLRFTIWNSILIFQRDRGGLRALSKLTWSGKKHDNCCSTHLFAQFSSMPHSSECFVAGLLWEKSNRFTNVHFMRVITTVKQEFMQIPTSMVRAENIYRNTIKIRKIMETEHSH